MCTCACARPHVRMCTSTRPHVHMCACARVCADLLLADVVCTCAHVHARVCADLVLADVVVGDDVPALLDHEAGRDALGGDQVGRDRRRARLGAERRELAHLGARDRDEVVGAWWGCDAQQRRVLFRAAEVSWRAEQQR